MRHLATASSAVAALFVLAAPAYATVTVCNEALATIHVAFAGRANSGFTTTGYWTVPVDACQDIDFAL